MHQQYQASDSSYTIFMKCIPICSTCSKGTVDWEMLSDKPLPANLVFWHCTKFSPDLFSHTLTDWAKHDFRAVLKYVWKKHQVKF